VCVGGGAGEGGERKCLKMVNPEGGGGGGWPPPPPPLVYTLATVEAAACMGSYYIVHEGEVSNPDGRKFPIRTQHFMATAFHGITFTPH